MNASAFFGCFAPFGIAIESTHENAPDVGMTYSMFALSAWICEHVARVRLREQQLAALQRVLVVGRDRLDLLLQVDQVVLGRVEVVVVRGVRVLLQARTTPSRTRRAPRRGTTHLPLTAGEVERVPVGDRRRRPSSCRSRCRSCPTATGSSTGCRGRRRRCGSAGRGSSTFGISERSSGSSRFACFIFTSVASVGTMMS